MERADPLGLDLEEFKAKGPQTKPSAIEIRKVAEKASFPSREAVVAPPAPEPAERRDYRTGRNVQFTCKVTKEVDDDVYAITEELERRLKKQAPGARWTVGMTMERMVAAVKREMAEEEGELLKRSLTTRLTTWQLTTAQNRRKLLVRKGGLEPPRYCYRQPLKLVDLLC